MTKGIGDITLPFPVPVYPKKDVAGLDIQALAKPILRHRVMTNFYAESERINSDAIIERLLETVPVPKSGM